MAHDFAVHTAVGRHILNDKVKVFFEQLLAFRKLRRLPRHNDDFVNFLARVLGHRPYAETRGQGFAPALNLGISALGTVEKVLQIRIAEGPFRSLYGAEDTIPMKGVQREL